MTADTSFKSALFSQYNQLLKTFDGIKGKVFWRTGNTLDACVHFMVAAQKAWGANDPDVQQAKANFQSLANSSFQVYRDAYENDSKNDFTPGDWWDDYGWWGVAALNAYKNYDAILTPPVNPNPDCYQKDSKVSKDCCLRFAMDSWEVMNKYAWGEANQKPGPYTPPVKGGCWNNYYDDSSGGVQNTVTNVLFLTLSAQLYQATIGQEQWQTQNQEFLNAACSSYRWFGEWFINRGIYIYRSPVPETLIYWILERPVLAGNEYNHNGKVPYAVDQKWTGDQGIFLGGLVALLGMKDAIGSNPDIQALTVELQKAGIKYTAIEYVSHIIAHLTLGITWLFTYSPRVLHEAPFASDLISDFGADYATGKGALMRYLGDVRDVVKASVNFQPFIRDSALSIITHPPTDANGHGFIWDDNTGTDITAAHTNEVDFVNTVTLDNQWDFVVQTARLDTLTAAIPLLTE